MAFIDDIKRVTEMARAGELEGFTVEDIQAIAPILAYHTELPTMMQSAPRSMLGGGRDFTQAKQFMADVNQAVGIGSAQPQGQVTGGMTEAQAVEKMNARPVENDTGLMNPIGLGGR